MEPQGDPTVSLTWGSRQEEDPVKSLSQGEGRGRIQQSLTGGGSSSLSYGASKQKDLSQGGPNGARGIQQSVSGGGSSDRRRTREDPAGSLRLLQRDPEVPLRTRLEAAAAEPLTGAGGESRSLEPRGGEARG